MKRILLLIAIAIMFSAVTAFAATTQDVSVSVEIPSVFEIDWAVSGATVDLTGANAITVDEFEQLR